MTARAAVLAVMVMAAAGQYLTTRPPEDSRPAVRPKPTTMTSGDRRRSRRHRPRAAGDWDCVFWAFAAMAVTYVVLALGIYFASRP